METLKHRPSHENEYNVPDRENARRLFELSKEIEKAANYLSMVIPGQVSDLSRMKGVSEFLRAAAQIKKLPEFVDKHTSRPSLRIRCDNDMHTLAIDQEDFGVFIQGNFYSGDRISFLIEALEAIRDQRFNEFLARYE